MRLSLIFSAAAALLFSAASGAAPRKATLGIFLPSTLKDGQERFAFGEALAASLSEALDRPVVAKSFGRYEDFSKGVASGLLDFAVVDSWAWVQLGGKGEPVALASLSKETSPRWAIVASSKGYVKDLSGKRLAVIKGPNGAHAKFTSNAIFGGDLDAPKYFTLVTVPNVESALTMMEAKGAEAALVPLNHVPKDARVLYRSARLPGALLVNLKGGEELEGAVEGLGEVKPFESFEAVPARELAEFKQLLNQGPAPRQPVMAESPPFRMQSSAVVNWGEVGWVLPGFADALDLPAEQPDP